MKKFFPWRLFKRFFLSIFFICMIGLISSLIITHFGFDTQFNSQDLFLFASCFFLVSLALALFMAYQFTVPMRLVILKTLRMANRKKFEDLDKEAVDSLFENEPGEYFELQQALDHIQRKMNRRKIMLAHEREESQALMSSLEDAVTIVSEDLDLLYFNIRFASYFIPDSLSSENEKYPSKEKNRSSEKEKAPIKITEVFRNPEILSAFQKVISEGKVQKIQSQLSTYIDINDYHFSITFSPLPIKEEKDSEKFRVLALFHDISEIKRAEKIRIEFVENASHELRTPLTSIKGYLETLREDIKAGQFSQIESFLNIISKNTNRLNDLVGDMLSIASLEHNPNLEFEWIEPEKITFEVFEKLLPSAQAKKITLRSLVQAQPFKVDAVKLEQVMINLIGNGIKYTQESGEVKIIWEQDNDKKIIILRVLDNGPGIPEIHLQRLFERFYRVDRARSRQLGGTGLGLSIVKHIMLAHGGNVSVKSKTGEGSEFICHFPLR